MPEIEHETGEPTRPKRRWSLKSGSGECVVYKADAQEVGARLGHVVHLEAQVTCKQEPIVTGTDGISVG